MDAQAMTGFDLAQTGLLTWRAGGWFAAGVLIGMFHFSTLRWNVTILTSAQARLPAAFALQFGRMALLAGMLATIAVRFGALPLVMAAAGIVVARSAAIRFGEPQ
jgi:F1F0 ATPase subunit 2